jgi:outer membrane lipoprotein-sorting protein
MTTQRPENERMPCQHSARVRPVRRVLAVCLVALACSRESSFSQFPLGPSPVASGGRISVPARPEAGHRSGVACADATDQVPRNSETLIDDAINNIAKLDSVTADLVQTVELLNQTVTITGHYAKARGRRIYLELSIEGTGDSHRKTVQVCDGETLWDLQEIADTRLFTRLALKPILKRLEAPDLDRKTKETTVAEIGFAGVDSLLTGLRKYYKFTSVEAAAGVFDGKSVWILHGTWSSTTGLLAPDASHPESPQRLLPPYVPGEATVYLGQADGWPYKVVLAATQLAVPLDTRRRGLNGEPIGARNSIAKLEPTKVTLTYKNVKHHAPLPADRFQAPTPTGITADDRTQAIINHLLETTDEKRGQEP